MIRVLLICGLVFGLPAMAQTGGSFDLSPLIAGGGGASAGNDVTDHGSVGQAMTSQLNGGSFALCAGFWPRIAGPPALSPTPTNSPTAPTVTPPTASIGTPTSTSPPTRTPTLTSTTVTGATATPSPTMTEALTPATPTRTPTPTTTVTPGACVGDCDDAGAVTVDEIIVMVNIALGGDGLAGCPSADADGDGEVSVDEIVLAVTNALDGCGAQPDAGIEGEFDEQM